MKKALVTLLAHILQALASFVDTMTNSPALRSTLVPAVVSSESYSWDDEDEDDDSDDEDYDDDEEDDDWDDEDEYEDEEEDDEY